MLSHLPHLLLVVRLKFLICINLRLIIHHDRVHALTNTFFLILVLLLRTKLINSRKTIKSLRSLPSLRNLLSLEKGLRILLLRRSWSDWLGLDWLVSNLIIPSGVRLRSWELVFRLCVLVLELELWRLISIMRCVNRVVGWHLSWSL